ATGALATRRAKSPSVLTARLGITAGRYTAVSLPGHTRRFYVQPPVTRCAYPKASVPPLEERPVLYPEEVFQTLGSKVSAAVVTPVHRARTLHSLPKRRLTKRSETL